jgi:hypothetical protein
MADPSRFVYDYAPLDRRFMADSVEKIGPLKRRVHCLIKTRFFARCYVKSESRTSLLKLKISISDAYFLPRKRWGVITNGFQRGLMKVVGASAGM